MDSVVGIDLDEKYLDYCRSLSKKDNVEFVRDDISKTKLSGEQVFDIVFSRLLFVQPEGQGLHCESNVEATKKRWHNDNTRARPFPGSWLCYNKARRGSEGHEPGEWSSSCIIIVPPFFSSLDIAFTAPTLSFRCTNNKREKTISNTCSPDNFVFGYIVPDKLYVVLFAQGPAVLEILFIQVYANDVSIATNDFCHCSSNRTRTAANIQARMPLLIPAL